MHITEDIRTTVYKTLANDSTITAHGAQVFLMSAPDNQPLPYIALGSENYTQFDAFQNRGFDCTLMVDIWDNRDNGGHHYLLIEDCYRLLDGQKLALETYKAVNAECEWHEVMDMPDDDAIHIPIRVRLLQQAPGSP